MSFRRLLHGKLFKEPFRGVATFLVPLLSCQLMPAPDCDQVLRCPGHSCVARRLYACHQASCSVLEKTGRLLLQGCGCRDVPRSTYPLQPVHDHANSGIIMGASVNKQGQRKRK